MRILTYPSWKELNQYLVNNNWWYVMHTYENMRFVKTKRGNIYLFSYFHISTHTYVYKCEDSAGSILLRNARNPKRLMARYYDPLIMEELL